jgi:membrane protease YdiL (CAAX protease family)
LQLAFLLSLLCVAALALTGVRPYVAEFHGRVRRTLAALSLIAVLAVAIFFPVTSFGEADEIDIGMLWFPSLFLGHVLLGSFLVVWWWLRGDIGWGRFLSLSFARAADKLRYGVVVGCIGWGLTLAVTGMAAAATAATGRVAPPSAPPEIVVWLVELPITYRLIIVGVAMTVEEAFFRGFLQPRVGLWGSSVMFALSHFSYGLPFMIVGVFTISLVIGRTFARTGDLLPCVVAHGVFDGVQLLVVLPWAVRLWGAGTAG